MCFIIVDSPSSSWTGALTSVYMTALDYDITVVHIDNYWCSIYQLGIQKVNN